VTSARFVIEGTEANPVGEVLDAVTASRSGLSYDAATDTYTYVWKTDKAWAKKTGQFVLTLSDGTTHTFDVSFKK
ncbi:MAG TPA: PxKF domain-containing protein, partial [Agromyces sp.]